MCHQLQRSDICGAHCVDLKGQAVGTRTNKMTAPKERQKCFPGCCSEGATRGCVCDAPGLRYALYPGKHICRSYGAVFYLLTIPTACPFQGLRNGLHICRFFEAKGKIRAPHSKASQAANFQKKLTVGKT